MLQGPRNIVVGATKRHQLSPREALESGISMIAQELMIVPQLSAAQNVYLGAEPRRAGWLQRRALRRRYQELARLAGFDLPADRPAGRMRTAEQQQVEILERGVLKTFEPGSPDA